MKKLFATLLCLVVLGTASASAQGRLPAYDARINPQLLDPWSGGQGYNDARWSAQWITSPEADRGYGVYFFRKEFALDAKPAEFIVHVSADNRYKFYVNGTQVAAGPAKGDVRNWSFDTVDLAPWLQAGDNLVAAVVWNFAEWRPVALMSLGQSAFLLQGNGDAERALDTGKGWQVLRTDAYSPGEVQVRGYYAAGCTDRVDGSRYPWGWEKPGRPDRSRTMADDAPAAEKDGPAAENGGPEAAETASDVPETAADVPETANDRPETPADARRDWTDYAWKEARPLSAAAVKGAGNYHFWYLVPRPIPPMEVRPLQADRSLDGTFIPAGQTRTFLLDNRELTTGYPRLHFSGGAGAEIRIGYAEALYEGDRGWAKGDRNATKGKQFVGYQDVILPDGGDGRSFEPLWWRTWRYLRLSVTAAGEPLTLDSLRAVSSMYPFVRESAFDAPQDPSLQQMLDIGWRTARLCAHETYMDCPYYEQLQYFGDARIQALVTMFNTRDTCLVRNLLEQGRQSLGADGLMMSRYPSHIHQDIAPYALFWLNTCHDWWMYRGDEGYLRTLLPAMRATLAWFGEKAGADGLLRRVPSWDFADWADLHNGTFPADAEGRSAYLDLVHILALRDAAEMESAFGDPVIARQYRNRADQASAAAKAAYWSPERQYFADNGDRSGFSQHINALAVLASLVSGAEAAGLVRRVLEDKDLRPCTIYFRYYLQRAMAVSGNGDRLIPGFQVLRDQMALGLTTWAEMPEPSRSDCHAWGSSPNIELFRTVLGIDSAAPGFRKVRIAPNPGPLKRVSGSIPHPKGTVSVSLESGKNGTLGACVTLPEGVSGSFVWKGRTTALRPGENRLSL